MNELVDISYNKKSNGKTGFDMPVLLKWVVSKNQTLSLNQAVAELETGGSKIEIGSPVVGRLQDILITHGQIVRPGQVIGRILVHSSKLDNEHNDQLAQKIIATKAEVQRQNALIDDRTTNLQSADEQTETADSPLPPLACIRPPNAISSEMRQLMDEHNIVSLDEINGTGYDGRVTREDLLTWVEQNRRTATPEQDEAAEKQSDSNTEVAVLEQNDEAEQTEHSTESIESEKDSDAQIDTEVMPLEVNSATNTTDNEVQESDESAEVQADTNTEVAVLEQNDEAEQTEHSTESIESEKDSDVQIDAEITEQAMDNEANPTNANGEAIVTDETAWSLDENDLEDMEFSNAATIFEQSVAIVMEQDSETAPSTADYEFNSKPNFESKRIEHNPARKAIGLRMTETLLNRIPHITTMFELNLTKILESVPQTDKDSNTHQMPAALMAHFVNAVAQAMQVVPEINSHYEEDALVVYDDINIGIRTVLENGKMLSPVVTQVQKRELSDITTKLEDGMERAQKSTIRADELQSGTFSIFDHGSLGSVFANPTVITPPQVATLGIGTIQKRPQVIVVDKRDVIATGSQCYVTLTVDGRAIDEYQANQWLSAFKQAIENA